MSRLFSSLVAGLTVLCLAFPAGPAPAAAYPERPITVICPFGAGSGADRILRIILPYLEKTLGQKLVMDYKAGGGGVVGSNYFMTTKTDGYTLLFYNQPHISMQSTFQKTAYNSHNLIPILGLTYRPEIITVRADSPFQTLEDLLDYAKANPGKLTIGNTGSLSSNHLTFAMFSKATGVKATRIPFESGGKMNAALLGGQIDACFSNMQWLSVYPGQIRALASTATERPQPDLPTFTELGYPDLVDIFAMNILYVKEGTPQEIIDALREKVAPLANDEQLKADYIREGVDYGVFDGPYVEKYTEQCLRQVDQAQEIIRNSMK